MEGGAWQATVHGVAKSWTHLRNFTFIFLNGPEGEALYTGWELKKKKWRGGNFLILNHHLPLHPHVFEDSYFSLVWNNCLITSPYLENNLKQGENCLGF